MDNQQITDAVRSRYQGIAQQVTGGTQASCCGETPACCARWRRLTRQASLIGMSSERIVGSRTLPDHSAPTGPARPRLLWHHPRGRQHLPRRFPDVQKAMMNALEETHTSMSNVPKQKTGRCRVMRVLRHQPVSRCDTNPYTVATSTHIFSTGTQKHLCWREVKVGILARLGQRRTRRGDPVTHLEQRRVVAVLGDITALQFLLLAAGEVQLVYPCHRIRRDSKNDGVFIHKSNSADSCRACFDKRSAYSCPVIIDDQIMGYGGSNHLCLYPGDDISRNNRRVTSGAR